MKSLKNYILESNESGIMVVAANPDEAERMANDESVNLGCNDKLETYIVYNGKRREGTALAFYTKYKVKSFIVKDRRSHDLWISLTPEMQKTISNEINLNAFFRSMGLEEEDFTW